MQVVFALEVRQLDMSSADLSSSEGKLGTLSSRCDYKVDGTTLLLLLKPGYVIKANSKNFLWSSGTVKAGHAQRLPLLNRLLQMKMSTELAEYSSSAAGVLGFSSQHPGDILIQELPAASGLFVFRDTFLVCSKNINAQEADFPVVGDTFLMALQSSSFMHHSLFYLTSPPAPNPAPAPAAGVVADPRLVFLQAGERIMEKRLAAGESFIVNPLSLVAFDDQVVIRILSAGIFSAVMMGVDGVQRGCLRIDGPGVIYLSGSLLVRGGLEGRGSGDTRGGHRRDTMNYLVPLARAIMTISTVMVVLSIVTRFMILGFELQELEQAVGAAAGPAGGVGVGN